MSNAFVLLFFGRFCGMASNQMPSPLIYWPVTSANIRNIADLTSAAA